MGYKQVRHYHGQKGWFVYWQKAVYDRCMARNADFDKPMDNRGLITLRRRGKVDLEQVRR